MKEVLSVPEAAREMGLAPSRVRAMAAGGALAAMKVGGRWLVDPLAVAERKRIARGAGRPFEPHNAWGLIALASGESPSWLSSKVIWRLRQALRLVGLSGLAPRLGRRARAHPFRAHPGEVSYLLDEPALVRSGISAAAAHGLDLVSGLEAEGYLRESKVEELRHAHELEPAPAGEANVLLRAVSDSDWNLEPDRDVVPAAAVALDLAEDPDPRAHRAGEALLRRLDDAQAWSGRSRGELSR